MSESEIQKWYNIQGVSFKNLEQELFSVKPEVTEK